MFRSSRRILHNPQGDNVHRADGTRAGDPTVSTDDNFVRCSDTVNNRRVAEAGSESDAHDQRRNPHMEWKWIRRRFLGSHLGWYENGYVDSLVFQDVDVSMDGKAWFDLVGSKCIDGLPLAARVRRRRSTYRFPPLVTQSRGRH